MGFQEEDGTDESRTALTDSITKYIPSFPLHGWVLTPFAEGGAPTKVGNVAQKRRDEQKECTGIVQG